ncbi:MAG: FtsK/SpoIIIE domain-containing protein [Chloroflexota bacterium]|nr:FtsK/SpoIIIE domain-containing protein [Chloroflexota bacterium]
MSNVVMDAEIVTYWRAIVGTLNQRGLLRERPRRGGTVLPEADAYLFTDRVVFALDMQRLAAISRETWLDARLWAQWRAALQGRRVFVSDGGGLAICVARSVDAERSRRLPAVIPLALDQLPDKPYHVKLGHSKRGPIILDLAGDHRAILIGGTSGSGKTNLMQSIILQLAAKHTPAELQVAIVDCKEVDFGADFARLPHLFAPIAHDLQDAAELIERVEAERLRRQAMMAAAGVADWRKCDGLGLLLLVVDEAADHSKTPAMTTLIDIARKGRAMGLALILGTQSPSSKVIDPQIRANLPTGIAFQTRTDIESRVILGKSGAEKLNRPGLALVFLGGRWETVQTLRVGQDAAADFITERVTVKRPALSEVEAALVRYAVDELEGAFITNRLYEYHRGLISKRALTALAQRWEARGWLTVPGSRSEPRRVTAELLGFV